MQENDLYFSEDFNDDFMYESKASFGNMGNENEDIAYLYHELDQKFIYAGYIKPKVAVEVNKAIESAKKAKNTALLILFNPWNVAINELRNDTDEIAKDLVLFASECVGRAYNFTVSTSMTSVSKFKEKFSENPAAVFINGSENVGPDKAVLREIFFNVLLAENAPEVPVIVCADKSNMNQFIKEMQSKNAFDEVLDLTTLGKPKEEPKKEPEPEPEEKPQEEEPQEAPKKKSFKDLFRRNKKESFDGFDEDFYDEY